MPNYHEPTTKKVETDIASVVSQLSGAITDISNVSSQVDSVLTSVSGSGLDVTSILDSILDSGDANIGIPNVNTGSNYQGHRCTSSNSETTLFATTSKGFCFTQAYNDPSASASAIIRVYAGSIATDHLIAYALIPPGESQVVCCSPAQSGVGFTVTAVADGTHNVCVSVSIYSPELGSTSQYTTFADSYIAQAAPNTNYGTGASMEVANYTGAIRKALLKPDLSALPAGVVVLNATLSLYVSSLTQGALLENFHIHRILQDWVEAEVTYNVYSTGNAWNTAGMASGTDYAADSIWSIGSPNFVAAQRYAFDVTTWIQGIANGSYPNYGIVIQEETVKTAPVAFFSAHESSGTSNDPILYITTI